MCILFIKTMFFQLRVIDFFINKFNKFLTNSFLIQNVFKERNSEKCFKKVSKY